MRAKIQTVVLIGLAALGSGCLNDDYRGADGLTDGAGNRIAGNTVMQMVDPWQDGVQDTRLLVPAARATSPSKADDAAASKGSQPLTN